jgi:hypothetical protein
VSYTVKWTNGATTDPVGAFSTEADAMHYAREHARGKSWSVWLGERLVVSFDALQGVRRPGQRDPLPTVGRHERIAYERRMTEHRSALRRELGRPL